MNKQLDNYLCKKYPKIFQNRNKSPQETCMCWGFPGNGWFYILDALCQNIQSHIDNREEGINRKWQWALEAGKVEQVIALQVKEKFSGLCFYYSGGDNEIRGMVTLTESLSYKICEECGAMDSTVGRNQEGWHYTSCKLHTPHLKSFKLNSKELFDIWQEIKKENVKSTN